MKRFFAALTLVLSLTSMRADIAKFDEEDMRELFAADPIALFTFPPIYAFSQGIQLARENHCRFFAFVYYEGNFGPFKTVTHFKPKIGTGRLLKYEDQWMYLEIIGYIDTPPEELGVFDTDHYKIGFYDEEKGGGS